MSVTGKRYLLLAILSVAGLAVLAAALMVALGQNNGDEVVVLGMAVGYCLLIAFAASTALDRQPWKSMAVAGITLSGLTILAFILLMLWERTRRTSGYEYNRYVEQVVFSLMLTASLLCLVPWVGHLRMKLLGRLLQLASMVSMLALYLLFLATIWDWWNDFFFGASDLFTYVILIAGLSTLSVFVVYKFFGLKLPDPLTAIDQKLFLRCPRCRREQELPTGESHCAACGLWFKIDMEEPKCAGCGYNLRGLTHLQCPECGRAIAAEAVPEAAALQSASAVQG